MAWQKLSSWAMANRPIEELRAAYRRTGVVAVDLDQCLYPGITQKDLGVRVARRLARHPLRPADRRFLPQLALGRFLLAVSEARRLLGWEPPIRRLIRRYERAMRGIPEIYFTEAARKIPSDSYAFASETVAELAAQAPTGIVSLGLDIVARAYLEQFRTEVPSPAPSLSFFAANVILFSPGLPGARAFERYDPSALMLAGEDKRLAMERRMAALGADVPTTIGHSEQDVPLARLSRERGGLAIGYNPAPALEDAFDVVVRGRDWEPMYALIAILRGAGEEGGR